ncbi:hypothetical protein B296_00026597 [Ensete ventricosum]|uniref:Retrotransposon gag domain-containing protein n=1 Tax=Ensete ventricosum TaxID=4639 RepID=A0A426YDH5_ENSVE|nr:hypothetical protein B296_00026597 [Ensete ventricosum]
MWYNQLKPLSVSSIDQLAREFEFNFLVSSKLKSSAMALLGMSQKNEKPLSHFVLRFATEVLLVINQAIIDNCARDALVC